MARDVQIPKQTGRKSASSRVFRRSTAKHGNGSSVPKKHGGMVRLPSKRKASASSQSGRRKRRKSAANDDDDDYEEGVPIDYRDVLSDLDVDNENTKIVRIGQQPNRNKTPLPGPDTDNMIDMVVIVVAICRPQKKIRFRAVDTWHINNETVGCYPNSKVIRDIYRCYELDDTDEQYFTPDSYFHEIMKNKTLHQVLHAHVAGKKHKDMPKNHEVHDSPTKPTPQNVQGKPPPADEQETKENIPVNVVFEFTNEGAVEDLHLNVNNQAEVYGNDQPSSYAAFLQLVKAYQVDYGGPYASKTIDQALNANDGMPWWCELEKWVLPNWVAGGEMYNWTKNKQLSITHFLHRHMSRDYGRYLYMEIRFKPRKDWQAAQEAWWTARGGIPKAWKTWQAYKALLS